MVMLYNRPLELNHLSQVKLHAHQTVNSHFSPSPGNTILPMCDWFEGFHTWVGSYF